MQKNKLNVKKLSIWLLAAVASTTVGLIINYIITPSPKIHKTEFVLFEKNAHINIWNGRKELKNVTIKFRLVADYKKIGDKYEQEDLTVISKDNMGLPMGCDYQVNHHNNEIEANCPIIHSNEFISLGLSYEGKLSDAILFVRAEKFDYREQEHYWKY